MNTRLLLKERSFSITFINWQDWLVLETLVEQFLANLLILPRVLGFTTRLLLFCSFLSDFLFLFFERFASLLLLLIELSSPLLPSLVDGLALLLSFGLLCDVFRGGYHWRRLLLFAIVNITKHGG